MKWTGVIIFTTLGVGLIIRGVEAIRNNEIWAISTYKTDVGPWGAILAGLFCIFLATRFYMNFGNGGASRNSKPHA
jgi:hypothetical protein